HAALVHHDVVERPAHVKRGAVTGGDGCDQRLQRLDGILLAHERVERPREIMTQCRGEETDPAEVDTQDGDLGAVEQASPAQQGAVANKRQQCIETGGFERRWWFLGPELGQARLDGKRKAPRGGLAHQLRQDGPKVRISRISDDADIHRASSDSSWWSAETRRAMPSAVRPNDASCSPRGACSIRRSGTPSATTARKSV